MQHNGYRQTPRQNHYVLLSNAKGFIVFKGKHECLDTEIIVFPKTVCVLKFVNGISEPFAVVFKLKGANIRSVFITTVVCG